MSSKKESCSGQVWWIQKMQIIKNELYVKWVFDGLDWTTDDEALLWWVGLNNRW